MECNGLMEWDDMLIVGCLFVFLAILIPASTASILILNTSTWTFTGHAGVASFLTIIPYIFAVVGALVLVYSIIKKAEKI